MRDIKFRAWDNVKNKMYYLGEESNVVFTFDSNGIVATDITEDEEEFKTLHHLEYMQFIGLKDMTGADIYEGDLLEHDMEDNGVWKTYEACAVVYYEDDASFCFENDEGNLLTVYRNFVVVGNIYTS